ncbi:E3 ubiquitin-protein ligase APD2-like isoform X1 [Quercus robur]|uniref:E3 ubiquitin-protein ligase APD2-like isoform X1 n=2 Tax=Quercus robur TaxID=38942 RepID=UPI0021621685|nr:E3 ubiquitin-protein ligase APD2-like isoform X1 [Quercus robur]
MYRTVLTPPISYSQSQRWRETWARLLAPLTIWLCVCVSLRYGYYGDHRMVLGPSSSRLMQASSVFVEQVEVRDDDKRGVFLYAFSEKPELSYQTNWSVSDYVIVRSYSRKGFSFWLNKGSTIHMRWEAPTSTLNQLEVVMTKGERDLQTLLPEVTDSTDFLALHEPISGKEVKYTIEEDDKYYIGVINSNRRSIIMSVAINVSATMYDTTKAKSKCSTETGSCRLRLEFPNTHYVILTTPNHGNLAGWYIELSFIARVVTYIAILGFIVIVVFLILKYLGACEGENTIIDTEVTEVRQVTETDPIMPAKPIPYTYGTGEEDDDSGDSSSSEELYDAKLCVICYDEQRNCFFVPCGHCATCYDCAQRIMEGENKVCPICRRLIHKLRRLFHS